jgi:Na+/H+ antiporter NhaC
MVTGTRQLKLNNEFDINQSTITQLGQVFGNGDSYLALVVGGAVGLLAAIGLHVALGVNFRECRRGAIHGAKQMMPAMVILWFAWALSGMTEKDALNTGGYLTGLLSGQLPVSLLPTVVFLLSALMAFATGTSWGTMGILTPVSVGLAVQLDYAQTDPLASAIVLATSGSVLAGAIFGDHCSPISDTTVLSSRASGCEHLSHVKTQFPYAMIVGGVCVGLGTIPAAFGVSPWICLLIGTVVIISVVTAFGKRVNEC